MHKSARHIKEPWSFWVQIGHQPSSLVMLTLQTTLVQIFLVLNTAETNTNRRAVSQFLGLHETHVTSKRESVVPGEYRVHGKSGGNVGWWGDHRNSWRSSQLPTVTSAKSAVSSGYHVFHLRLRRL